jgi:HD-GYP domain-containing protein (c-di-GMP phosphodiesterase class II)
LHGVVMVVSQSRLEDPPPGCVRTADLLAALSLAADLAVGLPAEHAIRSCYIGMHIADLLELSPELSAELYYAELLMDVGCTAWTSHLAASILSDEITARREFVYFTDADNPIEVVRWLRDYIAAGAPAHERVRRALNFAVHGKDSVREGFRNTCEVAGRFAQRLGMSEGVQTSLLSVFEQWDGGGPNGLRGDLVPLPSRIVYATSFLEAFHHIGGRPAAVRLAEQRKGTAFDPSLIDAFLTLSQVDEFWEGLEQASVWSTVLSMEPASPYRYVREERLEDIALAFADFADLKSFYTGGHSRRVGDLAEQMAREMHLSHNEVVTIRRAGLLHDLGLVAVPSFTLDKSPEQRNPVEEEQVRLHPYHAERILSRVPAFGPVVPLVAAHHERMDGRGYYHGLSGSQIPLGARIIAVADRFDDLSHDMPDHPALDTAASIAQLRGEVGDGLCPEAFEVLVRAVRADGSASGIRPKPRRHEWPAGLTDREVEILRLLTRGLNRREIAQRLFLSEHTVRHHLEHIYTKIGVSTRVAATLFAVEHGLLR